MFVNARWTHFISTEGLQGSSESGSRTTISALEYSDQYSTTYKLYRKRTKIGVGEFSSIYRAQMVPCRAIAPPNFESKLLMWQSNRFILPNRPGRIQSSIKLQLSASAITRTSSTSMMSSGRLEMTKFGLRRSVQIVVHLQI